MRSGTLRHRVYIQRRLPTRDAAGAETYTWTTWATRWASIEPLRGNELLRAQQVEAEVDTRIRLRWLAGVEPTDRILFGTRIFEVGSVINVEERDRELELMCVEAVL